VQWKIFRPRDTFIRSAVVPDGDTAEATLFGVESGLGVRSSLLRDQVEPHAGPGEHGVTAQVVPAVGVAELFRRFHHDFGAGPALLHLDCEGLDADLLDAMITRVPPEQWPPYVLMEDHDGDLVARHPAWPYTEIGRAGLSVLLRRAAVC